GVGGDARHARSRRHRQFPRGQPPEGGAAHQPVRHRDLRPSSGAPRRGAGGAGPRALARRELPLHADRQPAHRGHHPRLRRLPHPLRGARAERLHLHHPRDRGDAVRHALGGGGRSRRPQGHAPRRRGRGGDADAAGGGAARQRGRLRRPGLRREAPADGLRPPRLHRRGSARRHPQGHGRGGVPAVRAGPLVRPGGGAARQGPGHQAPDPERGLLLGAAVLLDRHPGGSLHPGDRHRPHRGLDRQPAGAVRRQPADPAPRRLQGLLAPSLRAGRFAVGRMGRSLTRKLIEAHLVAGKAVAGDEIGLRVDQALLTDTNGTMAFLQFEAMGFPRVRPGRVVAYIDHNVYQVDSRNSDDHRYLQTAARRYGAWFSKPGNGICHQVHFESFSVPGEFVLGTDSHTPLCGSTGMLAIGAGGLDVAVAMGGGPYYLTMPRITSVWLTGRLRPWVSAKDVIMELLRRLSVRGGSGRIFEYGGPGAESLSLPQRATICNMGAELTLTTSVFPSDEATREYFRLLGREAEWRPLGPDPDAE